MFHGPYHMIKKLIGNKRENTSTIGTRFMASGFTIWEVLAGNQALRLVLGPHFCWLNSCFFSVQSPYFLGEPPNPPDFLWHCLGTSGAWLIFKHTHMLL